MSNPELYVSELDELLDRHGQLEEDERYHRKMHDYLTFSPRYRPTLIFTQEVLRNRTLARLISAARLHRSIRKSEARRQSAQAPSRAPRPQGQEYPGLWLWLERLEKELLEEKTFLDPDHGYHTRRQEETKRQLIAWQAELDLKDAHATEALKLVLKFKADRYTYTRALQVDCIERISNPSFPQELRALVVETTVRTQIPYCRNDQSIPLARVANKAFRKLPEHLEEEMRSLLKHTATRAMQMHSLVAIPAIFTLQFTLAAPPEIHECGHLIRYLALDLYTQPRDGAHSRELNRGSQGLASLKSLFPNLESCIVMVHLGHNVGLALSRHINDQPGRQDFASACLAFRNVIKANNIVTLEETLVRFIAAFLEGGPGKRKFVRFAHSNPQEPWLRIVGPLVRASRREPSGSLLPTEEPRPEEGENNVDAESIFKEAYWGKAGPLRDWAASFRAQQV